MALLVNYEGSYLPPQKLWYLIDGVWKEVTNVYESSSQQELAILDQERIKQDQVVGALQTKASVLMASIDGSNPTIPLETDPIKIESILTEVELLNLQLDVAKTEQVVLTKQLFEQKAQVEYIKLVTEGEIALAKIGNIVTNPSNWRVIRIAPQSTLDERLEVVIQSGLENNDRIFNYGLVYYRLYEVNSAEALKPINNPETLALEFQRRLNKEAYTLGTDPLNTSNYVFTTDTIQNVYTEVNQFVNAGAKRIEDYLASIKDQQKYILDNVEIAKEAMLQLEEIATSEPEKLNLDINGHILTSVSKTDLQVTLGEKLLAYQNVTSFTELVSTKTLQDIASGTKDIADYPGVVKLNNDVISLNEKLKSVQDFQTINNQIQKDLTSGSIVFNLTVLNTKKSALTGSKTLFWSNPLGDSTIAANGGVVKYTQTYTSSGTYKFKNNEMVTLSTTYIAIINSIMARTSNAVFGVTFKTGEHPRIIQVQNGNLVVFCKDESPVITKVDQKAIINVDTVSTGDTKVQTLTKFNDKNQPHTSIAFVKENTTIVTPSEVNLAVYHPVINGLFYANTEDSGIQNSVKISTPIFENAFSIHQILLAENSNPASQYMVSFGCRAETPQVFKYNDNIISQVKESIHLDTDPVDSSWSFNFNTRSIPLLPISKNDNIIEQKPALQLSIQDMIPFSFNIKQTNNYSTIKNGYNIATSYVTASEGVIDSLIVIEPSTIEIKAILASGSVYKTTGKDKFHPSLRTLDLYEKTRRLIIMQTGLVVIDLNEPPFNEVVTDTLNVLMDSVPRMLTSQAIRTIDLNTVGMDVLNNEGPNGSISYMLINSSSKLLDLSADTTKTNIYSLENLAKDGLNSSTYDVTGVIVQTDSLTQIVKDLNSNTIMEDTLNIDGSSILSTALQTNPGVSLL